MTTPKEETYVYQDIEVKLTGRTAQRDGQVQNIPAAVLVEITPVDDQHGTWKKWIPKKGLFKISDA